MRHVTLREATWFLVALAGTVVALTVHEVIRGGDVPLLMYLPAGLMLAMLAAWPFLNGWRPWTPTAQQLQDCARCGAQWRPADEDGMTQCPACVATA